MSMDAAKAFGITLGEDPVPSSASETDIGHGESGL
jgi:hypothetical protein